MGTSSTMALLTTSTLDVHRDGAVGIVTFTRDKKFNSFVAELYSDIPKALTVCAASKDIAVGAHCEGQILQHGSGLDEWGQVVHSGGW